MSDERRPGHVVLNVNVLDVGIAHDAWRSSALHPLSFVDIDYFTSIGRIAERGTLDGFFLADGPGLREDPRHKPTRSLEPSVILSAVAAHTEYLGLIGTASTTFNDPWELASRLLSLDYASGGRVAWNVVTTYSESVAGNFGLTGLPDRDVRYRRAGEFVDVVTGLWRSALHGDQLAHDGEFFSIAGHLAVPPLRRGIRRWCRREDHPQGATSPAVMRTLCSLPNSAYARGSSTTARSRPPLPPPDVTRRTFTFFPG